VAALDASSYQLLSSVNEETLLHSTNLQLYRIDQIQVFIENTQRFA